MTTDLEPLAEPAELIHRQLEDHLTAGVRILDQLPTGDGDELRQLCASLVEIGNANPGLAWEIPAVVASQVTAEARRRVEHDADDPAALVWHLVAGCAVLSVSQLHALRLERELGIDGEDPMFSPD